MSKRIECFVVERTNLARVWLRRHADGPCPPGAQGFSYHDARVLIADAEPYDSPYEGSGEDTHRHDDPRWPATCARCATPFADLGGATMPGPAYQLFRERLYRHPDGHLLILAEMPPGALWRAAWYERDSAWAWVGADKQCWACKLPDGTEWVIDGPANNAPGKLPGWDRKGTAPKFTVTPSILSPGYHGFLTDGVLIEC